MCPTGFISQSPLHVGRSHFLMATLWVELCAQPPCPPPLLEERRIFLVEQGKEKVGLPRSPRGVAKITVTKKKQMPTVGMFSFFVKSGA